MSEEATLDEFVNPEREVSEETEQPELIQGVAWSIIKSVPEEWTVNNVESDIDILSGNNFSSEYFVEEGGIPLIRIRDLAEDDTTVNFDGEYDSRYRINQQDLLVGMDGEFEPHLWAGPQALLNQRVCKIEPKGQYNKIFFRYAIEKPLFYIQKSIAGTTVKHLSQSNINDLNLLTPPLPEQRKIATVLYTIDRAIEKTEEVVSKIETVKNGLIQNLFAEGYFDHNGSQGDQWAKFPEDWELISVDELIDRGSIEKIMDGNHGERHPTSDDFVSAGIPFVTSNVVEKSQVRWEDCKRLEQHTVDNLRKGFAKPGDVLLTHKGHVGRVGKVPESIDLAVLSPQVTYYRCREGINPDFLMYYFLSSHVQKQLQAHSTQTTRDYVGITKQRQLQLALPRLKEQEKIVEVLSSVEDYLTHESKAESSLERLKRGLMQDLLSGKIRTTDTNIEFPEEIAKYG
jgi:type I restriction enzyme S subunit